MVYIVPLGQSDLEQTIECVSRNFTQETMSKALGINRNSYMPFAEIVCQKAIEEQLSLVAKDEESEDIIGFSILEDCVAEFPDLDGIDPQFIPIMNLLGELGDWHKSNYQVQSGDILHLFMTGVDEQYRRQGIASQLLEATISQAKSNNYNSVIAECTGAITQNITTKYGFKAIKEIDYKSYIYNGELVFKDINETRSCKLMLKKFD
jgi:ribosomal protein S18 acetylase RimI-like enzyme